MLFFSFKLYHLASFVYYNIYRLYYYTKNIGKFWITFPKWINCFPRILLSVLPTLSRMLQYHSTEDPQDLSTLPALTVASLAILLQDAFVVSSLQDMPLATPHTPHAIVVLIVFNTFS